MFFPKLNPSWIWLLLLRLLLLYRFVNPPNSLVHPWIYFRRCYIDTSITILKFVTKFTLIWYVEMKLDFSNWNIFFIIVFKSCPCACLKWRLIALSHDNIKQKSGIRTDSRPPSLYNNFIRRCCYFCSTNVHNEGLVFANLIFRDIHATFWWSSRAPCNYFFSRRIF